MGRIRRITDGGLVYHVLNRANARLPIFTEGGDYTAFEQVLEQAVERVAMRLLAYCVMPNHWHLVVWPRKDGELSEFVGWLTLTHTQRWHAFRGSVGSGHVYQGRFRSFVVQSDAHLFRLCRYVERNPLRAGLTRRAENWRWSSLWRRQCGDPEAQAFLTDWPVTRPRDWLQRVNRPETDQEVKALRRCVDRSRPFGTIPWVQGMVDRYELTSTFRPRGRPRKEKVSGTFS